MAGENSTIKSHSSLRTWSVTVSKVPRYECGYPKCATKKRELVIREPLSPASIQGDVIVMHGLISDVYDLERYVASIRDDAKVLITAITVCTWIRSVVNII